ncbi:hypothetical protein DIT68_15020 [Brumimicrobium oceani]|uniref:DUF819 domain-containing protein n=2 Tax=Brumimicrobium oceani TaxID=2100725 RepID=A0A2U2X125_9FLAO|nr:hypothetical protein DIT68_15020 [Brumimicrobium oceani]
MESYQFGKEKKIYSTSPYGIISFDDDDRRVLKNADEIQVFFNEDSIKVNSINNIFFKNPGPDELIKVRLKVYKNNEELTFNEHKGETKVSFLAKAPRNALVTDDRIVLGILTVVLALIFFTASLKSKAWKSFYTIIPALFLCYMIPASLTSFNIIDPESTNLYYMASRYLLPGSLILLILSADIKSLIGLGSKSLIMFFTGTIGIILGGVFAVWIFTFISPETVGGSGNEATWKGLATIAGSWIGGGANQTAMLETYKYKETLFGGMILVDIVVANIWMAVILFGIGKKAKIDKWLKADSSSIDRLVVKVEDFQKKVERKTTLTDFMVITGLVFGGVALAHFAGKYLSGFFLENYGKGNTFSSQFFWMVVISTVYGLILSFTRAKNYEGAGASKIGSVFLYILVATIGMKVDITMIFDKPLLIFVGLIWMAFHALLLIVVAKIIKAPFFFLAVGSQANVGGAASAPIVANAFHPALTTVGVLMAVVGYFIGTFGAIMAAELMRMVAPM